MKPRVKLFQKIFCRPFWQSLLAVITYTILCSGAFAQENVTSAYAEYNGAFVFYLENDVFNNTDRYYTNGVKLLWISGDLNNYSEDKRLPAWSRDKIESLPVVNKEKTIKNIALSFGQNIYTPMDISRSDLIEDDRPYAGYTYLGIALHSRSSDSLDTLEFDIGIVGPDSYAKDVQVKVHNIIESEDPKGWNHQLKNEPVLNIIYEKKYRLFHLGFGESPEFDFISHIGGAAGNAYTYLNFGFETRLGINLPFDFGTGLIRPAGDSSIPSVHKGKSPFGFHIFGAVDSRTMFRNIFLDGNTFTDSHEVNKKTLVSDITVGACMQFRSLKITYSHVYRTKEFESQRDAQIFGSISISYLF